ncbi:hypothetical protein Tco_1361355 [Tanacetum coccineum]
MEQEIWTLTLKGCDIEAYNNRFHKLDLMCPELVPTEKKKIEKYVRGFLKESKEISLLQNLQICMRQLTWPVNWSSNQFRVGLQELGKEIKGNGKTTRETTNSLTQYNINHNTTITATETTIITNNKTRDQKLSGHMLQPQLEERFMLEIYQNRNGAYLHSSLRVLKKCQRCQRIVS